MRLPLAARALGVLDALGRLQPPAVPADLAKDLRAPAFNSYVEEGRVGGVNLIIALYPTA